MPPRTPARVCCVLMLLLLQAAYRRLHKGLCTRAGHHSLHLASSRAALTCHMDWHFRRPHTHTHFIRHQRPRPRALLCYSLTIISDRRHLELEGHSLQYYHSCMRGRVHAICTRATSVIQSNKLSRGQTIRSHPPTVIRRGISMVQPPSECFCSGTGNSFVAVYVTFADHFLQQGVPIKPTVLQSTQP